MAIPKRFVGKKRLTKTQIEFLNKKHANAALYLKDKVRTEKGRKLKAPEVQTFINRIRNPERYPPIEYHPERGNTAWNAFIKDRTKRGMKHSTYLQMVEVHQQFPTQTNQLAANIMQANHWAEKGQRARAQRFYAAAQQDFIELEDLYGEELDEEWLWYD